MFHDLADAAYIGGHHGKPERHGFFDNRGDALGTRLRCHPENVERCRQFGHTASRISHYELLT
jgi:hypothetical protein